METRVEKNKRLAKLKYIKRLKRLCVFFLLILLALGLERVNQNIIELNCLENPYIIRLNINTKEVDFFGQRYIIDLSFLKK